MHGPEKMTFAMHAATRYFPSSVFLLLSFLRPSAGPGPQLFFLLPPSSFLLPPSSFESFLHSFLVAPKPPA
jgi:hypothetical protein